MAPFSPRRWSIARARKQALIFISIGSVVGCYFSAFRKAFTLALLCCITIYVCIVYLTRYEFYWHAFTSIPIRFHSNGHFKFWWNENKCTPFWFRKRYLMDSFLVDQPFFLDGRCWSMMCVRWLTQWFGPLGWRRKCDLVVETSFWCLNKAESQMLNGQTVMTERWQGSSLTVRVYLIMHLGWQLLCHHPKWFH